MVDGAKLILWLLLLSSSPWCFCSELDVQCLKTLYRSVIDPYGRLASSWEFVNPSTAIDGYICNFTGVECWQSYENRVLALHLDNLGLQGPFPQGLQNCTSMTGLDLSSNNFSGPIPADISRQVPYLTSLDISYNSFSGPIPASISNMTYLNTLNLQHNQLSGEIPRQFDLLGRLNSFNVAENLLSGPIPYSLWKFSGSNFAENQGLYGAPLHNCPTTTRRWRLRLHRINDESSIGAAVGFVVGFVVAFYFPHCVTASVQLPSRHQRCSYQWLDFSVDACSSLSHDVQVNGIEIMSSGCSSVSLHLTSFRANPLSVCSFNWFLDVRLAVSRVMSFCQFCLQGR